MVFNYGWEINSKIKLFEKTFFISVVAESYFAEDKITKEQECAFVQFKNDEQRLLNNVASELMKFARSADVRFTPRELVFKRNGECALLFDDTNNQDEGIAVLLDTEIRILSQDEYL